jgi:hypothetical protein
MVSVITAYCGEHAGLRSDFWNAAVNALRVWMPVIRLAIHTSDFPCAVALDGCLDEQFRVRAKCLAEKAVRIKPRFVHDDARVRQVAQHAIPHARVGVHALRDHVEGFGGGEI